MGLALDLSTPGLGYLPGTGRFIKGTRTRSRLDAKPKCHGATLECTEPRCIERIKGYDEHLDWRDSELAAHLGMKENSFAAWRIRHGLPPKPGKIAYHLQRPRWSRHSPEEIQRRTACYHDHPEWTDTQMASHLGITRSNIREFRQHNGLPPHRRRGERPTGPRLSTAENARRLATYHRLRGRADEHATAQALGLTHYAYREWRRSRGLPLTSTSPTGPQVRAIHGTHDALTKHIELLEAYLSRSSDAEAAAQAGFPVKTYERWRRRMHLSAARGHRPLAKGPAEVRVLLEQAKRGLQTRNLADAAARLVGTPQLPVRSTGNKGVKNASTMRSGLAAGSINMHREPDPPTPLDHARGAGH
ncbi:MAG: hypothetical protein WDA16_08305 [Candidatus Thermoplasmatota archaeon]